MPLVLDTAQSVTVQITQILIRRFEIDPDKKSARILYELGTTESGIYTPSERKSLTVSGSNFDAVRNDAEQIAVNEGLGVYGSTKKALYNYVATFEGVTGTVQ